MGQLLSAQGKVLGSAKVGKSEYDESRCEAGKFAFKCNRITFESSAVDMRWRRLSGWPSNELWRGSILRLLKTDWPYESPVDLMLVTSPSSPSGFSLVVTTGYKAGSAAWDIPKSALAKGKVMAISRDWLLKNWEKRIYAACPVSSVRIIENYPTGIKLKNT